MASKITKFDRATCKLVGEAFHKMTADFAVQYGLTVKPGGGRFDANTFTPKVSFCIPAVDEQSGKTVNKKDMENFKMMAPMFGIDPDAFGKEVVLNGKTLTIIGWNSRASKSPINLVAANGAGFKCPVATIKSRYPAKAEKKVEKEKPRAPMNGKNLTIKRLAEEIEGRQSTKKVPLVVGIINEQKAKQLCPEYVDYVKGNYKNSSKFDLHDKPLKKGMLVLVHEGFGSTVVYKIVKIQSIGIDRSGEPNSKVRVADNEYSWRIDNCYIIK
jgi:hypothetical protein